LLELIDVSTSYGHVGILRRVNLRIDDGKIVSLLGGNGAGKTTTLKAILGIVKAREGKIRFEETDIQNWQTNRIIQLGMSVVPEGRRLFLEMTVLDNLHMGGMRVKGEKELKERLRKVFEIFPNLENQLRQYAGTLSGGEQAMVAIGRGLIGNPKILLLDEPSLGLAPILVEEFFKAIKRINDEGTTVFLIEQNARKALSISTTGYVLQKGQIVVQGSREELFESDLIKKAYLRN